MGVRDFCMQLGYSFACRSGQANFGDLLSPSPSGRNGRAQFPASANSPFLREECYGWACNFSRGAASERVNERLWVGHMVGWSVGLK